MIMEYLKKVDFERTWIIIGYKPDSKELQALELQYTKIYSCDY